MTESKGSAIPSREQYEQYELMRAYREMWKVALSPLADRKDAQEAFFKALHDPELLGERVEWLLIGNYGKGQQLMAERVVESPRSNRVAALSQLIACFEWRCGVDRARTAWKKCTKQVQDKANQAVQNVINEWEAERDAN